ncbi:MAG: YeeE/YedE thiosulfate transporter family protein [bacterium]
MMPFYPSGSIGLGLHLFFGLMIGFGFGFFLEKGGLGYAPKLAGQFYFRDLTVFKVMFTAVLTAMIGLFWFSRIGLLDFEIVTVPPTYLWPQFTAGVIFGVGFVISGLCPGTAWISLVSGKWDGAMVLLGIFVGTALFTELFPVIGDWIVVSSKGRLLLPDVFGMSWGVLVMLIAFIALGAFALLAWFETPCDERRIGDLFKRPRTTTVLASVAFLLALSAAISGDPDAMSARLDQAGMIGPVEVGRAIMTRRADFTLIDIRDPGVYNAYHIPSAMNLTADQLNLTSLSDLDSSVVIYGAHDVLAQRAASQLRTLGVKEVQILRGGIDGWRREVLFPVVPANAEGKFLQNMSRFFGGSPLIGGKSPSGANYTREGC